MDLPAKFKAVLSKDLIRENNGGVTGGMDNDQPHMIINVFSVMRGNGRQKGIFLRDLKRGGPLPE